MLSEMRDEQHRGRGRSSVNPDTIITHPDVVFYDFYAAWDNPISLDKDAYLDNRTRILTQAAPNIGPMVSMPL